MGATTYYQRLRDGLCVECGERAPAEGRRKCDPCAEAVRYARHVSPPRRTSRRPLVPCDDCGTEHRDLIRFRKRMLCGDCLNRDEVPPTPVPGPSCALRDVDHGADLPTKYREF